MYIISNTTYRYEGTLGSKATGEPSMLMGVSVAFAIRNALRAGREELGISGDANIPNWVDIGKKNIHRILNHLLVCRQRVTRTFLFSPWEYIVL